MKLCNKPTVVEAAGVRREIGKLGKEKLTAIVARRDQVADPGGQLGSCAVKDVQKRVDLGSTGVEGVDARGWSIEHVPVAGGRVACACVSVCCCWRKKKKKRKHIVSWLLVDNETHYSA
jgi:hypothetical protein